MAVVEAVRVQIDVGTEIQQYRRAPFQFLRNGDAALR
jgi:hypothetical protein